MKTNFAQLSTKDLATLSQRTISVSDEPTFTVVKDNPLLAAVKTEYNYYDAVYTKKAFSGKGGELIKADDERDSPFGGIKDILSGHIKSSSSPCHQEAKDLYAIIEKYGIGLDRLKFAEETAQMKKLIEDFDKPENIEKIEKTHLTPIVSHLKVAHTAFEKLFNEIAAENAELRMLDSASTMRRRLETALKNYFNIVKAMKMQTGWSELYAKLDELSKAAFNSHPTINKTTITSTTTETK